MATILLPYALREHAGGAAELPVAAGSVEEALGELVVRHPRLRRHLYGDDGALRGHVRLYLNMEEVASRGARVGEGDTLMIVPSIAGGAPGAATHAGSGAAVDSAAGSEQAIVPEDAAAARAHFTDAEVGRYARHIALPEVGWEGQRALQQARVLVVGAGGLGSPVGLYLAAAGVGTIGLVDFDRVDLSNLQRQVMYATADVGRPKVEAARERLAGINPHVTLVEHPVRLTSENALDIIGAYDIVVDGTDNFATRYLVNDACVLLDRPYVYGSIFRFEGQVAVFGGRQGPCYRCLFREPPPPGMVPSCAEGGVLGVLPGIIGSLQALETIKLILGRGEPMLGRLALFDALDFRWRELRLKRNASCPACGDAPTITHLIDYDAFCGTGDDSMARTDADDFEWSAHQLKQRLESGEPLRLIDVREPFEWEISNLAQHGAQLVPMAELAEQLPDLERDQDIVLYCRSGSRSGSLVQYLRAMGFERVYNLSGGINAWAQSIDPSLTTY